MQDSDYLPRKRQKVFPFHSNSCSNLRDATVRVGVGEDLVGLLDGAIHKMGTEGAYIIRSHTRTTTSV